MNLMEANRIINRRNRWCRLLLKLSPRARFLETLLNYPILRFFGKSAFDLYEKQHPEVDINEAFYVCLVAPIARKIDYTAAGRKILNIEKLN